MNFPTCTICNGTIKPSQARTIRSDSTEHIATHDCVSATREATARECAEIARESRALGEAKQAIDIALEIEYRFNVSQEPK